MDNQKYISIIVPVFNVEKYICECLDSVLSQTYRNFELILVDDGSTDKSGVICDEYAEKDSRISVYHQSNQGQAAARNFGVEKAKYDWIVFVDSDDVAHPQLLECLINGVKSTGTDISACPRIQGERIPADFLKKISPNAEIIEISEDTLTDLYKNSDYYWALFPSLVKKSILLENPFTPGRIYEDNAVCYKWLISSGRFCSVDIPLYFYRTTPNSTMNKAFNLKQLDYLWALNEQIEFYDSSGFNKMLNLAFSEYFYTALTYSKWVKVKLKDVYASKKVSTELKFNIKKYKSKLDNFDEYKLKMYKEFYPFLFRMNKKIKFYWKK